MCWLVNNRKADSSQPQMSHNASWKWCRQRLSWLQDAGRGAPGPPRPASLCPAPSAVHSPSSPLQGLPQAHPRKTAVPSSQHPLGFIQVRPARITFPVLEVSLWPGHEGSGVRARGLCLAQAPRFCSQRSCRPPEDHVGLALQRKRKLFR